MVTKFGAFNYLTRKFLGYEYNLLVFSQAGEDVIVRNFFYIPLSQGKEGFYVDIGAYHPYQHSNTFYLYRAGWRGINIDARPGSMELFNKIRPEDINLEMGVAGEAGSGIYYDFGDQAGLNTMSVEYIEKLGMDATVKQEYEIKTLPLAEILEKYVPKDTDIDFLSIDIEGMEEPALASNNWQKYGPKLIACEIYGYSLAEIAEEPAAKILISQGYEIYARVILSAPKVNTIFFVDSK